MTVFRVKCAVYVLVNTMPFWDENPIQPHDQGQTQAPLAQDAEVDLRENSLILLPAVKTLKQ